MKLNSFSPLPDNDEELHLPELVYAVSLEEFDQFEQLLSQGIDPIKLMMKAIVRYKLRW